MDSTKAEGILISEPEEARRETYRYSERKCSVIRRIRLDDDDEIETSIPFPKKYKRVVDSHESFDRSYLRMKKRPSMKRNTDKVRVVDLFSGCGGLSLGAWEACRSLGMKFAPIMAGDNNDDILSVYKKNFKGAKTTKKDLRKVIDGDLGSRTTKREGNFLKRVNDVDILLAGPPCQGHSNLNNHTRRNDERNSLYLRVIRFAELSDPTHIIIENVPQVKLDKGEVLQKSIEYLRKLHYHVDHDVVNLWEIGVPQRRKRHVLIASRDKSSKVSEIVQKFRIPKPRNLRWAIEDLARVENGRRIDTPSQLFDENVKRIKYLFDKNLYDLPNPQRPECHHGDHNYRAMYGRLKWKEPAPTITTGFLSPGQGRYVHPSRRRTLTPHEAARIQFFPDFFDFSSATTRDSLKKMIGNAVPMKLAYIFTLELLI